VKHFEKFILLIFAVALTGLVFQAQNFMNNGNPNVDHIYMVPNFTPSPNGVMAAPVTSVDGYDVFSLGTDFAEPHISVSMQNSAGFFSAYNTNGTHRTINGWDWFINNPSFPVTMHGDPVTAYDSLGNLFYENMYGSISGCYVIKSTNNAQSWGTGVIAISGGDKNWIACDQTGGPNANYIYTTMTNTAFSGANFARSTDHGATFTQTNTFSLSTPLPGTMVAVGPYISGTTDIPGGCVYVVTHSGNATAATYTFHRSTDGGLSFTQMSAQQFAGYVGTISNGRFAIGYSSSPARVGMRTRPYPMIASDNSYGPYRGRLYLAYCINQPNADLNKPDIFSRYSTDGGVTWSSPSIVNDDPNTTANHQWFPAIWCDKKNGRLYIKWYDTRNCPTSDSTDVYATYSDDGGQTFKTNQRITPKVFKIDAPNSGGGGTPRYQGDYDAITSYGKSAMLAYTDFTNGGFGSYSAYFPDYAMQLSKTVDSLNPNVGGKIINMNTPSVKLYSDTVIVSSAVTPVPTTGNFTITYPSGYKLTNFPGVVPIRVACTGGVTEGVYTLTVTSNGPNGTPIHVRTASLVVSSSVSVSGNAGVVNEYKLYQNFPNPFNPLTKISFNLLKQSNVKLTIYDITGKEISSVIDEKLDGGMHDISFDAGYLSTGVYFYKIEAGDFKDIKKMILLK